jgi:hypothetical protein
MAPSAKAPEDVIEAIGRAKLEAAKRTFSHWLRISARQHENGRGFSLDASSRFSDPRRPYAKFGVIYLGQDLTTAVAETIVRDQKDGHPGFMPMSYEEAVGRWRIFDISTTEPLALLDLTGTSRMFHGVPTDTVLHSSHGASQALSLAIHEHERAFDGILYASRHTGSLCIALYDRAFGKLSILKSELLSNLTGSLAPIFKKMGVTIVP